MVSLLIKPSVCVQTFQDWDTFDIKSNLDNPDPTRWLNSGWISGTNTIKMPTTIITNKL